ncbi:unnamed protein product [Penicillium bialowiezense]
MANKMISPDTVCTNDPITVMSTFDQAPQKDINSHSTAFEDLLHPCHFNWADEVEDSIAKAEAKTEVFPRTNMSTSDIRCYFPRVARPTEAVWPQPYTPKASRFQPTLPTIIEESDEDLDKQENTKTTYSPLPVEEFGYPLRRVYSTSQEYLPRPGAISPRFNLSLSTISEEDEDEEHHADYKSQITYGGDELFDSSDEESFSDEGSDTETIDSSGDEYDDAVQECFDEIYDDRYSRVAADSSIHHFNWAGYPVSRRSTTSPSESLALIMSDPKVPRGSSKYRSQAILNNAFLLVDPVIMFMDGIDKSIFKLRGSKLANASAGRVYKFYSPHGLWLDDANEPSDVRYDSGFLDTYQSSKATVGNGFYGESAIRPISNWMDKRNAIFEASDKHHGLPRKNTWKPKPSPLSQCETSAPVKLPLRNNGLLELPFMIQCDEIKPTVMPRKNSWRLEASSTDRWELITPAEPLQTAAWLTRPSSSTQCKTTKPTGLRGSKSLQLSSPISTQSRLHSVVENSHKSQTKPEKRFRKWRTTIPRSQATTASRIFR